MWLRSEDTTRTSTRAARAKGPMIEVDLDDNDDADEAGNESSSEANDTEASYFKLRKRAQGKGTSTSGAAEQDPPEDTGREKRQKVRQDKAPQAAAPPVSTAPVPRLSGRAAGLLPATQKPRAKLASSVPPCALGADLTGVPFGPCCVQI